jgi:PiT family inorganic phosphate transporter
MLILIGTVPTAYALNHAVREQDVNKFVIVSTQAQTALSHYERGTATGDAHAAVFAIVQKRTVTPEDMPAIAALAQSVETQVKEFGSLAKVPANDMVNIRNNMYLLSESLRLLGKSTTITLSDADKATFASYKKQLDNATRFIPTWVKVAVAIALGLGTMIGWKRIVVTVGERIGKTHLTYAQGASAEIVAMATIGAAEMYGLPVSTTHVLSSGVAGTMVANHSGLQWATVRNLLMAWVLTLPVSIALAGGLYWLFRTLL